VTNVKNYRSEITGLLEKVLILSLILEVFQILQILFWVEKLFMHMPKNLSEHGQETVMIHTLKLWCLNTQNKQTAVKQEDNTVSCETNTKVEI
jgi:hypothetical protein